MSCVVKWCPNSIRSQLDGIYFHRFPKGDLMPVWKNALGLDEQWQWSRHSYVCSMHFKITDYVQIGDKLGLKLDAVPFNGVDESQICQVPDSTPSTSTEILEDPLAISEEPLVSVMADSNGRNEVLHNALTQTNEDPAASSALPAQPLPLTKTQTKRKRSPNNRRKIKNDFKEGLLKNSESLTSMDTAIVFVEDYETKKVKVKLSTQETEVCILCFGLSKLQPVATSPWAEEFNNFNFIEIQIGYRMPERICSECLTKLNDIASFIKMCKDSYAIYTKIEEHQKRINKNDANKNKTSVETNATIETEVNTPDMKENELDCPVQEKLNEATVLCEETQSELISSVPGALLDHLYYKAEPEITKDDTQNLAIIKLTACPTCDEKVAKLTAHYKKQPRCRPKKHQCPVCSLLFRERSKMLIHQRARHSTEVPLTLSMCHICSKTFKYAPNLQRHLRVHEYGKQFICEQCGKGYTTATHLRAHQNIHLNIKPYLCSDCGEQFTNASGLYVHKRRHEKAGKGEIIRRRRRKMEIGPRKPKTVQESVGDNEDELVACPICDRQFVGYGLKIHMHTHNEDRIFTCKSCKTAFETELLYRRHLKTHARKEAACPYCLKKYDRYLLKQHIATHTDERPFACPECGKKFRTRIHLGSHRLSIHNVNRGKPWKCKHCNQSFTFRGNLRVHERIHTGETPYDCHVCDAAFSDSKKRKKHVAQVHGKDELKNIVNLYTVPF